MHYGESMNPQAENYWPEPCAYCGGTGTMPTFVRQALNAHGLTARSLGVKESAIACVVCAGKAFALVLTPSRACKHCQGTGRALHTRCAWCRGTGWMFVYVEHESSTGGE